MSFKQLPIKLVYKSYKDDFIRDFYTPVLKQTVLYQRAVGFFSSSALIDLTLGLKSLIKKHGTIQLLVSPRLSEEDIEAIDKGYEQKEIIGRALMRDFKEPESYFEKERLNFLAYLIEEGFLDIKVVFTPSFKKRGMYHEKVGIVKDEEGNRIVFTGSLNDSNNAYHDNRESIVVFKSWEGASEYVDEMQNDFNALWNKEDRKLKVYDFPNVLKEKFEVMRNDEYDYFIDSEDSDEREILERYGSLDDDEDKVTAPGIPCLPKGVIFRDYQDEAVDNWESHNFRGIFDMATGTGKTYTGLEAVVRLFEKNHKRLATIIVCPYQHLVEQWVEDIIMFNMKPIIGYSASKQSDWKKRLEDSVIDFKLGVISSFCFVTTNATYSSAFVSKIMSELGKDTLLLIDEAHNFGAENLSKYLHSNIQYRLALSATLDRAGDPDGTKALYDYFGEKCAIYDLEKAIKEHKLTPYKYYPIPVYLTNSEYDKYLSISYEISKECYKDENGKWKLTEKGKRKAMERARLVAGALNKIDKLRDLLENYKNDDHILVYCGATRLDDFSSDESERDLDGERQIVAVSKMMGNELGMKVTHFTSNESAAEREIIKQHFADANPYQAIIAIKCLDEGVNIPSIKTAFILASTTNPKEYIQRRGRVLRLYEGKLYAVIYDFVTLAKPLNEADEFSSSYEYEKKLATKELQRIKEFGRIALNASESDKLIEEIEQAYNINEYDTEEAFDDGEF